MKNIIALIFMFFSLQAFSASHVYWIEQGICVEVDPFVIGDACLLELKHDKDHIVVITDFELPSLNDISESELEEMDVELDKKHLKRATKKQLEALDGFAPKGVPVYTIDAGLLKLFNVQED